MAIGLTPSVTRQQPLRRAVVAHCCRTGATGEFSFCIAGEAVAIRLRYETPFLKNTFETFPGVTGPLVIGPQSFPPAQAAAMHSFRIQQTRFTGHWSMGLGVGNRDYSRLLTTRKPVTPS